MRIIRIREIYANGKQRTIGIHCPKNADMIHTQFNLADIQEKAKKYFMPHKAKKYQITVWVCGSKSDMGHIDLACTIKELEWVFIESLVNIINVDYRHKETISIKETYQA